MTRTEAETLALEALAFVVSEPRALDRFLALSGLDAAALRRTIEDPETLAGALDFLLADEPLLLEFCTAAGIPPEAPARARRRLPGFSDP